MDLVSSSTSINSYKTTAIYMYIIIEINNNDLKMNKLNNIYCRLV